MQTNTKRAKRRSFILYGVIFDGIVVLGIFLWDLWLALSIPYSGMCDCGLPMDCSQHPCTWSAHLFTEMIGGVVVLLIFNWWILIPVLFLVPIGGAVIDIARALRNFTPSVRPDLNRMDTLNKLFGQLCEALNANSLNYCVNIVLYHCAGTTGPEADEIIKAALGDRALLGGHSKTDRSDVLNAVIEGLKYEGDQGSHPDVLYLRSADGHQTIEEIARVLTEFLDQSTNIYSFWLKEGHPFHPVFWDYAYTIEGNSGTFVLIGSSSD